MKAIPAELIVLGGGSAGVEIAQVAAARCETVLVEENNR